MEQSVKKEAKLEISDAKYRRRHGGIWQERFYEHTIRDEKDWLKTLEYIHYNPIKHGLVEDINDWEYSSFYKKTVGRAAPCPTKTSIKKMHNIENKYWHEKHKINKHISHWNNCRAGGSPTYGNFDKITHDK
ncbi:MAG: Unknown protein [uncultured Sulfurovum sp.]|uniref:Transposase and inactivated derivatives n=1 Tax=uncultured Sulfurovum sp. TaxID=269237 RepID=A0A6S6SBM0_9BACT|nr:MAG: Unknown protein [uncultured Sulfurovum sp.]